MNVIRHAVRILGILAVCFILAACPVPNNNANGFLDEFEVNLGLPDVKAAIDRSTINDDPNVAKVYAKVFNATREHLPAAWDADSVIQGVTELKKNGSAWSGTVKLAEPASGTITFLVWAENASGQHLYSGCDDLVVGTNSNSITVATKEGYAVGDMGPAGGYVFYDDAEGYDEDNNGTIDPDEWDYLDDNKEYVLNGNRFLEVAPLGWHDGSDDPVYVFGYYRPEGTNVTVGTSSRLGNGDYNTILLTAFMKDTAYTNETLNDEKAVYAAKVCQDYIGGGYDDWFLPCKDELNLIRENLYVNNLGGFSDYRYWSSTESGADHAWAQYFLTDGSQNINFRSYLSRVRPVRAF